ncbi:hypothetical protein TIFTF001_042076 [Ficus carica]|uniref:Uncharacterized protein n=1 Tax=Ficus carica TaxID=3494 RepID=A0AA87ZIL0_FICCA|nr:hypothetical protein TIFTF001_042074 [Ficus carica]GMN34574.1 hypothetical protein TIFTF001_042076 [Ficus carica]
MLLGFCKAVSPLSVLRGYPPYKALRHSHLLDLLHHLVTLSVCPEKNPEGERLEERFIEDMYEKVKVSPSLESIWESSLEFIEELGPQEFEKPVKLFQEEILIPKASELHKSGIKFRSADHITQIRFELDTRSFHLPIIKIDSNSEVLGNLVAYEATIKLESDSLILSRYMELMSCLEESPEDVTVLKEVILPKSRKEEDVAKLFSGMSKSIRATNTSDMDKAIADVNQFYKGFWKVSASTFVKKWPRTTGSYCKVLGALLVLLFMAVQAFCSVYKCHRLSLKLNTSQAQQGFQLPSLKYSM